jgi:formylglycine-generating enzyme required for sulfatase activity
LALSGAEPVRTWTDLKGRKMEASFIMYSGDKILIKRADGKSFTLSPALFSAQDQKYLADLKKAVEAPNQTNAKGSTDNEYFKGATIVVSIKGEVSIDDPSKASGGTYVDGKYSSEANAQEGDILSPGSQIKVGANSEIILLFSNGTITTLGANTQMTVRKFLQKGFEESDKKVADLQEEVSSSTLLLDLQIGDLVVDVKKLKKESNFEITSPLGVAGIRGTSFSLSASADSTKLSVLTGLVGFASNNKKQNQVGTEKGLVSSREKEPVINDLADAQKQSIAQTVARAKKEAEEISLSTLRDKLGKSFTTHVVPSAGNLEMIWVEPGKFMMGETGKQHQVILTKGFYLGRHEVTQAQWKRVMGSDPSKYKGADRPVETVSWIDAVEFCAKLTEMEKKAGRVPEGMAYQLPTDAQWEYACRAGTTTVYSWGDPISLKNASYGRKSSEGTTPVGKYPANPWGFDDMHGNVWEWCADWYAEYPKGAVTDPTGAASGSNRVFRGGSWIIVGTGLRSAIRSYDTPSYRANYLGFRVGFLPSK